MAQRYIPAIKDGDKRILLIGGVPVPYSLARVRWRARCAATWPPAVPAVPRS